MPCPARILAAIQPSGAHFSSCRLSWERDSPESRLYFFISPPAYRCVPEANRGSLRLLRRGTACRARREYLPQFSHPAHTFLPVVCPGNAILPNRAFIFSFRLQPTAVFPKRIEALSAFSVGARHAVPGANTCRNSAIRRTLFFLSLVLGTRFSRIAPLFF